MLEENTERKNSDPSLSPAQFLIGIRNKIYEITEDFDVAEVNMPFMAIGGASDYSMGSLEATTNLNTQLDPEHHLIYALKTAAKYNAGVKGPFQLVNTGDLCLLEIS
jgi:ATP-dependent protease HslVU (ClpYQ) peptidase subunit